MVTKKRTIEDELKIFRPIEEKLKPAEQSSFYPKEELFILKKSYFRKNKEGVNFMDADWKKIVIGGKKITLFKGSPISKTNLKSFDDEGKKYYLYSKKQKSTPVLDDNKG